MTTQHFLALELDTTAGLFNTVGIFDTPEKALTYVRARPNYEGCEYRKYIIEMWEDGIKTTTVVATSTMTAEAFNARPRFVLVTTAYDEHGDEHVTGVFHDVEEAFAFTHPDTAPVEEAWPGEEPRVRKHPTVDAWAGDMSYNGMEINQTTNIDQLWNELRFQFPLPSNKAI